MTRFVVIDSRDPNKILRSNGRLQQIARFTRQCSTDRARASAVHGMPLPLRSNKIVITRGRREDKEIRSEARAKEFYLRGVGADLLESGYFDRQYESQKRQKASRHVGANQRQEDSKPVFEVTSADYALFGLQPA